MIFQERHCHVTLAYLAQVWYSKLKSNLGKGTLVQFRCVVVAKSDLACSNRLVDSDTPIAIILFKYCYHSKAALA